MSEEQKCRSRRTFLKQASAFLAVPAVLGTLPAAESYGASTRSETPIKPPCSACTDCTARFCRYYAQRSH